MIIIYRASSQGNPNKEKIIENRNEAIKVCFKSFKLAFKDVRHKLLVVLDRPNPEMRQIFQFENTEECFFSGFDQGNTGTFHKQIDYALGEKDTFLFVEDDYLFLPGSGLKIKEALKTFPFITPYNHPGYYTEEIHKKYDKGSIKLATGQKWKRVLSTTLTFGGQYWALKKEAAAMKKYGWSDHSMWLDITQRQKLYTATPSLATHIEKDFLSEGNWDQLIENITER